VKPARPIRRFDVFAEYRKQEQEAKGTPAPLAKGYGLWVAKVVASRRFGGARRTPAGAPGGEPDEHRAPKVTPEGWHLLDDEPQTDDGFEREIVRRMGTTFYSDVFVPAIREARERGQSYEDIRDAIRKAWNAPGA
jgi:hypothetical protein